MGAGGCVCAARLGCRCFHAPRLRPFRGRMGRKLWLLLQSGLRDGRASRRRAISPPSPDSWLAQPYVGKGKWISVGHLGGCLCNGGTDRPIRRTASPPPSALRRDGDPPSPDTVCGEKQLVSAFAQYGRTSRVPLAVGVRRKRSLLRPATGVATHQAHFRTPAAISLMVKTPPFGSDGHQLFSAASGDPGLVADRRPVSGVEQSRAPRPSDRRSRSGPCCAPSSLSARGREAFKTYLDSGPNKAFAAAGGSHFGWATGRRTADQARKDCAGLCASSASAKCAIVNVNNKPAE